MREVQREKVMDECRKVAVFDTISKTLLAAARSEHRPTLLFFLITDIDSLNCIKSLSIPTLGLGIEIQ